MMVEVESVVTKPSLNNQKYTFVHKILHLFLLQREGAVCCQYLKNIKNSELREEKKKNELT